MFTLTEKLFVIEIIGFSAAVKINEIKVFYKYPKEFIRENNVASAVFLEMIKKGQHEIIRKYFSD